MGWYFGKAPTVNPSVKNQRFLPAPFGKGAFAGSARSQFRTIIFSKSLLPLQCPVSAVCQSPPCQRGVVWRSQTGGIPQGGSFPHGFVLMGSACCGIPQSRLRRASSLWQGSHFAPGIVTLQKAWFHTSLREGGGLGRSPKTEGASGRKGDWTVGGGTSPGLSGFWLRSYESIL